MSGLHTARRICCVAGAWVFVSAAVCAAAEPVSNSGDELATAAEVADPAPTPIRTLDLGEFHLRDLRPARDVTAELRFSLHLELTPDVSAPAAEALQHWKHRLRDETITAVRVAEMADFAEPELTRVQKIILRRMNRRLPAPLVKRLLITGFTLGDL